MKAGTHINDIEHDIGKIVRRMEELRRTAERAHRMTARCDRDAVATAAVDMSNILTDVMERSRRMLRESQALQRHGNPAYQPR